MLTEALAANAARGAYPPSDPPQTRVFDNVSYVTYRYEVPSLTLFSVPTRP